MLLATACIDAFYGLFAVLKSKGFILVCLPHLSPAPHELVALLLEGRSFDHLFATAMNVMARTKMRE